RDARDLRRSRPDAGRAVRRAGAGARHELPGRHRAIDWNVTSGPPMPTIRQQLERLEAEYLAPQAARSAASRGRLRPEPEDPIRPIFQRDRDRIIHSKAFRRLKHKTQVFFAPAG